jgi:hypothetical protein
MKYEQLWNWRTGFVLSNLKNNVWSVSDGNPYIKTGGTHFADPRPVWSLNFKYRTTLVQKVSTAEEDHGWIMAEVSRNYLELDDAFGRIPEVDAQEESCVILTILSERNENLESFGGLLGDGGVQVELDYEPGTPVDDRVAAEFAAAEMDAEEQGEEIVGRDIPEFQQVAPALREDIADENQVIVGDLVITPNSSVVTLRETAKYLKFLASGSKTKIFRRIRNEHIKSLRLASLQAARQEYQALNPEPRFDDAPAQPSERERKLHEVTHVPFKEWCSFCVKGKSKNNSKHATSLPEVAQREHPTVQADFYTLVGNLSALILIDCWTKYVMAEPLRNKNQGVVGQVVARFLATMGYFQKVELAFDNEPVLAAGMRMAQNIRANHGLETILQPGLMYNKSRTSLAERTIQTVRGQGKTFIAYVEHKIAAKLPEEHPLHAWAMIHASWILNRFHVSNVTGVTSHMALRGRPYNGRICSFACEVYALDPLQARYQRQWRRGVWLTKDEADHSVVCVGTHELIRSEAVPKNR